MRLVLLALLAASAATAQTVTLSDGWGNLPYTEQAILLAGGMRAPDAPIRPAQRSIVLQAGTFAMREYPRLFGVPAEPFYTLRDGPAYQFLYLASGGGTFGSYFQDGYFVLNASTLGRARDRHIAHTTLHEAFHAFQRAAPSARVGYADWVHEGAAEAASTLAYGRLNGFQERDLYTVGSDSERGQAAGARPYDYPLHRMDHVRQSRGFSTAPVDYMTLSFWRFVMQQGPERARLLGRVFETVPASSSDDDALTAVDAALKASRAWQGGVAQAFPAFVADFIEWPGREDWSDGLFAPERWPTLVFRELGCPEVELGPGAGRWTGALDLRPVAARCLGLRVTYPDALPPPPDSSRYIVSVEAKASGRTDCRALALGTRGVTVPGHIEPTSDGGCRVGWFVRYDPLHPDRAGGLQALVLSNVSPDVPAQTRGKRVAVTVSLPMADVEAAATGMARGAAAGAATRRRVPSARGPRRGRVPNGSVATPTADDPAQVAEQRAACPPQLLAANACGPQTVITLTVGETGEATGAYSASAFAGGLPDLQLMASVTGDVERMGARMHALQSSGVTVSLHLPALQPGFTGTISNADVRLEWIDGEWTGELDARGPRVAAPSCRATTSSPLAGVYLPAGSVTIDHAGTDGIVGSFSATLYEDDEESEGCDPPRIRAGTVSGTFTTSALLTRYEAPPVPDSDDLTARLFDRFPLDALVLLDYAAMVEGLRAGMEEASSDGDAPPSGGTEPSVSYDTCRCACSEVGTPDENRCAPLCQIAYAGCSGDVPTEADLVALIDRITADAPPEVRQSLLDAYVPPFRDASDEEKRQIVALLRMQSGETE